MAKKGGKSNQREEARRVLAKAQLRLEVAQEKHAQERVRGQQEVEAARLRAAKWLAKAAQRVDRRAQEVARAESQLTELETPTGPGKRSSKSRKRTQRSSEKIPASPESTADLLEDMQTESAANDDTGTVVAAQTLTKASSAES